MRRCVVVLIFAVVIFQHATGWAAEGKVCKVLPQFLDEKGRTSLAPSLYERDAYQFYLRRHVYRRSGLRLAVEWKAKDIDWHTLKLRAEMRGLVADNLHTVTLETPVKKGNIFGHWAEVNLTGPEYKKFGELVAWRVTLLEGDKPIDAQESFLWSGVATNAAP
jgi:hypothetical protein